MKTNYKPSTSKLVKSFDKALMNIIMNDLKAIRATKTQLLTAA